MQGLEHSEVKSEKWTFWNHGYEPESKLRGIVPSASRDNSTCKLQCTLFLMLGSHYNLPIPTCDL